MGITVRILIESFKDTIFNYLRNVFAQLNFLKKLIEIFHL